MSSSSESTASEAEAEAEAPTPPTAAPETKNLSDLTTPTPTSLTGFEIVDDHTMVVRLADRFGDFVILKLSEYKQATMMRLWIATVDPLSKVFDVCVSMDDWLPAARQIEKNQREQIAKLSASDKGAV